MMEINFKKPEKQDFELLDTYFRKYPTRSCDRTATNLILWSSNYHVLFAEYKGTILFKEEEANGYAFPVGPDENVCEVLMELIEDAKKNQKQFYIYEVTKEMQEKIDAWFPMQFETEYDRDSYDYVYEVESLATLKGKKLHSKRNHINKFLKLNEGEWSYESMSDENIEECLNMASRWCEQNGCHEDEHKAHEVCVTKHAIVSRKELGMIGGVLRLRGEVIAFTIGKSVNEDTFVTHIEKAYANIDGAYAMINQQFAQKELLGNYTYVNREEDLGEEGLRKAKLSYRPAFLVEKGISNLIL